MLMDRCTSPMVTLQSSLQSPGQVSAKAVKPKNDIGIRMKIRNMRGIQCILSLL
jgi:hypothetical protein